MSVYARHSQTFSFAKEQTVASSFHYVNIQSLQRNEQSVWNLAPALHLPATVSLMDPLPPQSSTRTATSWAAFATPTPAPIAVPATCVLRPRQAPHCFWLGEQAKVGVQHIVPTQVLQIRGQSLG
jgi:hypothetical protein